MPIALAALLALAAASASAQDAEKKSIPASSSYAPVVDKESFEAVRRRMSAEKAGHMKRQRGLLEERYDLSDRPSKTLMSGARKKPVQEGARARLPAGWTWERLAGLAPAEVRERDLWPKGFLPLPHANQNEGGMLFPRMHIDEVKRQEGRDLERFDLDHDFPEHLLPAFPPPIFLTTRPDLGDASKGELVTIDNFYRLFNGVLNPKDIEGLRLLVTPFPQQQFNATDDRRSVKPHRGVACFDCHANGHSNAATHLVGDIRPQPLRRRIDTPSLRGVNIQRLFGSQRALKTVEDFTEFEQRAAYFDGDPVIATKKGVNVLERGSQVHFMAEVQNLLDFPPAPKLRVDGTLDPAAATPEELRGQAVFHGKGKCATCHPGPHFTDNSMHDLKVHRFYAPRDVNGRFTAAEGPVKTFPLRGIKDSPPYLHDGRLLTLDDTVEFFNLVLETRLTADEKKDLVAYLKAL